jgi:hypothetical protein
VRPASQTPRGPRARENATSGRLHPRPTAAGRGSNARPRGSPFNSVAAPAPANEAAHHAAHIILCSLPGRHHKQTTNNLSDTPLHPTTFSPQCARFAPANLPVGGSAHFVYCHYQPLLPNQHAQRPAFAMQCRSGAQPGPASAALLPQAPQTFVAAVHRSLASSRRARGTPAAFFVGGMGAEASNTIPLVLTTTLACGAALFLMGHNQVSGQRGGGPANALSAGFIPPTGRDAPRQAALSQSAWPVVRCWHGEARAGGGRSP